MEHLKNFPKDQMSEKEDLPLRIEKNPIEEEVLLSLNKIEANNSLVENLSQKISEENRERYLNKFQKLKESSYEILKKIELKSAYLTQHAFLPETLNKLSLIKKIVPWFKPQAHRSNNMFGGPTQWHNDFENVQEMDFELLKKLSETGNMFFSDSVYLLDKNYDLSNTPGFVNHFMKLNIDELKEQIDEVKEEKSRGLDSWYLTSSANNFFVVNYEKISNKSKLAEFSILVRDYLNDRTRSDHYYEGGGPRGGSGIDDPKRLPEFLVINSQFELTDEKLDSFLNNPERDIAKFVYENHPWIQSLSTMLNIQKQSEKQEFNIWLNDLIPLVKESEKEGVISFDSRQDAEILLDFVKTFGMRNTPELLRVFVNLKRAKTTNEIDQKIKDELKNEAGIDVDTLCAKDSSNIGLVINEITKYKKNLLEDLKNENENLPDKIINSKLNADIFSLVKGTSPYWKKKVPTEDILKLYKKFKKEDPKLFAKLFTLKEGYDKSTVEIPEVVFGEITDEKILKEKEKILENPNLTSEVKKLRGVATFFKKHNNDISLMRNEVETQLLADLANEIENTKTDYQKLILSEQKNEKMLIGIKEKLSNLESSLSEIKKLNMNKELKIHDLLKEYQNIIPDKLNTKKEAVANMSLVLINEIMPGSTYSFLDSASNATEENFIKQSSAFLSHDIKEHILNKNHDQDIAGKFDPSVIKAIKRAWGLTDKNIVIESSEKLSNLEKGELTGKNRTITFIPSKGLKRIFAGNIGGTCIDSMEEDFAKGKFENITSYSLVLDEGKTAERFMGTFLVIETETENKEPAIIIRSNNPAENLFSMVDGDSLIKSIFDQVKKIAEKRGIKHVAVPVSDCGRSSSNREVISQFYKTNFSNNPKLGLVKNKETEFNGYPIWNKNGKDAVVEI